MEHNRVFKAIKERIEKGENMFFIYGEYKYMNDLFYTRVQGKGKLLSIRESIIESFKNNNLINYVLEIYYDSKTKLKSSKVLEKQVKIKDELGEFVGSKKSIDIEEFDDNFALINRIKSLNLNNLKEGRWLIIFDDFNQIGKIYKGFDSQEIGRLFSEVVSNWRKMPNNYYVFLIRDKELGWLEDFGINKNVAIEVMEPSVHEIAYTMVMIAKENNKVLYLPLDHASKYVENPKPLAVIKKEFEEKIKQIKDENIYIESKEDDVKLDDVKLSKDTKNKIKEIFEKFKDGRSVTNGLILYGPPGTGKTTIAKALANESGSFFLKTSASDFKGEYLGQSGQNTRRIFEKLKLNKPAILFIDEADAILAKRVSKERNGDTYTTEIVNEFLANVDGLKSDKEIFVIIATNYLDRLDDAIISRFEKIEIPLPDGEVLRELVKQYLGEEFEDDYMLFYGLSGRDISQIGKQLKEGIIKSKNELIDSITKIRLTGLEPIKPNINFSNVYGYEEQKKLVKELFDKNIKRIVVFGKPKVGKTFFIHSIAGEFGLTIIRKLPENQKKLYGMEDKIIFYSKNFIPEDLFEKFSTIPAIIEIDSNLQEASKLVEYLELYGFEIIELSIDEQTAIEFIKKKFNIDLNKDEIIKLVNKSFPYIENYIKLYKEGKLWK